MKSPWRRHLFSAPTSSMNSTPRAGRLQDLGVRCRRAAGRFSVAGRQTAPNTGSRFLLDQPTTSAGRRPDSDIFLDDVTVRRRHAEFRLESDGSPHRQHRRPEWHLRRSRAGQLGRAGDRRRSADGPNLRLVFLTGPKVGGDEEEPEASDRARDSALSGMSIGAVLDLSRPDLPDVTISKVRFLEAKVSLRRSARHQVIGGAPPTTARGCASS